MNYYCFVLGQAYDSDAFVGCTLSMNYNVGCFVLGQAHNSEKDRDTETQYLTAKVLPYEFMLVLNINDIMVLISLSIIIILLLLLLFY